MTPIRLRSLVRDALNAALAPTGLGIGRRALLERGRRATYREALEHAKRVGLAPRTVIDVGVAQGTPPLYEAFPGARHVLIEPVAEARPHIEALSHRFPNIEHVEAAAARAAGRIVLNVHRDIARTSRFWESDYVASGVTAREVEAVTLDGVRSERSLEGPILLKIDVQGAELDVLEGAPETLRGTEYVVLEVSLFQFFDGAPLHAEVIAFMAERGFVAYDVLAIQYRPLDGAVSMLDLAFVPEGSPLRATHRFQLRPLL